MISLLLVITLLQAVFCTAFIKLTGLRSFCSQAISSKSASTESFTSSLKKIHDYILLEDLPTDRSDTMWSTIQKECELTVGELFSLKNYACPGGRKEGKNFNCR